ncbi:hypothetical protein BJ138DRAFT_1077267 [Hygrophoropsis aurantiaca]|uniref:Uncharacterized protein n=1 Tax=Hygrophoropsis aurantiaca TaxID=72124 RepID=A0ACB8APV1_9AGAM|nr:hypothetical protein BJ138DRAFT_1077267 [Hygrophoropsis aurantiaca]
MIPRRDSDMLSFLIIGGSIAGLACAYSLREAGHKVTVLEQSDQGCRSRGGIRSPPNMTRLLNHWGLGPAISKVAVRANQFTFQDGWTGEPLGVLVLHDKLMKALMADFLYIQHGELSSIFFDLARNAGVIFKYNTRVDSIDPWAGSVTTQNGSTFTADVIIGADGYRSVVRPVVVGSQCMRGVLDKRVSINITVPRDLMRKHEDLAPLADSLEWTIWLGDDCAMHGLQVKQDYAIVMHVPSSPDLPKHETWAEQRPIDRKLLKLDRFEPRAQKLVGLATSMTPTHYVVHEPFDNWVHESGKVVLVGEAAHPLMPNGSHNHSMSIEDAMTLSTLFSLPATRQHTPLLLSAYEELRQARCVKTQSSERQKRDFICLPHGPEQRARDDGLRGARERALLDWDDADDEFLRDTWEEYIELFAFDAKEAVEDWWTKWGPAVRARGANGAGTGGVARYGYDAENLKPRLEISVRRDGVVI